MTHLLPDELEMLEHAKNATREYAQFLTADINMVMTRLSEARSELDVRSLHTCHAECKRAECVLRRERDALKAEVAEYKKCEYAWAQARREVERLQGIAKDHEDDWRRIQDAEREVERLNEKIKYWEKHHMESHSEWLKKEAAPLYEANRKYDAENDQLRLSLRDAFAALGDISSNDYAFKYTHEEIADTTLAKLRERHEWLGEET